AVFPWIRLAFRQPFGSVGVSFPPGYFIEPTTGAFFLAPFTGVLLIPALMRHTFGGAARILLWTAIASPAAILLFLAATGFTTHRYSVDFLPLRVLGSAAIFAIEMNRSRGVRRAVLQGILAATIIAGAVANLALGIAGPYDEMLRNRPASYLRIA